jgi:polyhydroxyalkanoic acid synthase PhaR subunit
MPDTETRTDGAGTEAMELWRNWLTETERQWNSFFAEVMGRDSFGRVTGSYMEVYSVIQRALNQGMERYLNTFNLPTRTDVVELSERLHNIEERLASLEANLNNLANASGVETTASVTQLRPRRTRRPRNKNDETH